MPWRIILLVLAVLAFLAMLYPGFVAKDVAWLLPAGLAAFAASFLAKD